MDRILIISSKGDYHTDHVINYINNIGLGDTVIRLNTEDFYSNVVLTYENNRIDINIIDSEKKFDYKEIKTVWYRRPEEIKIENVDKDISDFIFNQTDSVLKGLYYFLHNTSVWFNRLDKHIKARIKLDQFLTASKIGFNIPETIISNNFEDIKNFIEKVPKVSTKSLSDPNFKIGERLHSYFNRVVDKEEIYENKESINMCFNLFQEYIEKKSDIRVVYLGGEIFAFEINSQSNNLSTEDFRGASPYLLEHNIHTLPTDLEVKIKEFVQYYELNYSALDFVLDKNGNYFFLENNPNGQWLWLEYRTNFDLTKHFVLNFYKNTEHLDNIRQLLNK